jgi:hypothetical protein
MTLELSISIVYPSDTILNFRLRSDTSTSSAVKLFWIVKEFATKLLGAPSVAIMFQIGINSLRICEILDLDVPINQFGVVENYKYHE